MRLGMYSEISNATRRRRRCSGYVRESEKDKILQGVREWGRRGRERRRREKRRGWKLMGLIRMLIR